LLKSHSFLEKIEFSRLREQGNYAVPWVPQRHKERDTTHFDDFSDPDALLMYGDIKNRHMISGLDSIKTKVPQIAFAGFTFKGAK
jgi:cell cycle protein kinase DBF2